ncbi:MAG: hypothetical protein IKJ43_02905 [Bacilli bacterium]|nr:hypothetical protein [Bacilli bacterium]
MKIIGIGGNSTTGKSTLARLISEKSKKSEVIPLDYILDDVKKKISSKDGIVESYHGDGNLINLKRNPINNIENRNIKGLYYLARNIFITSLVQSKLLKLYRNEYDLAIIEGVILEALYLDYDYLIKTQSPDSLRIKRRQERDNMIVDAKTIHEWDKEDRKKSRYRKIKYDRIINNDSTLQDYDKLAEEIYEKVMIKGTIKR